MADSISFEIELDGTITVKTDEVSPVNHKSADQFLKMVKELAGGEVKETKLPHSHGTQKNQIKVGR